MKVYVATICQSAVEAGYCHSRQLIVGVFSSPEQAREAIEQPRDDGSVVWENATTCIVTLSFLLDTPDVQTWSVRREPYPE